MDQNDAGITSVGNQDAKLESEYTLVNVDQTLQSWSIHVICQCILCSFLKQFWMNDPQHLFFIFLFC